MPIISEDETFKELSLSEKSAGEHSNFAETFPSLFPRIERKLEKGKESYFGLKGGEIRNIMWTEEAPGNK